MSRARSLPIALVFVAAAAGVVVAAVGTYLLQPAAPAKTPRRATLAPAAGGRGLIYTLRF